MNATPSPADGSTDDPAGRPDVVASTRQPDPQVGAERPLSPQDAARRTLPGPAGSAALDRIAVLASQLLTTSSSQVSLLTEVQTIAAGAGLAPGAVGSCGPLADSLCTVTAGGDVPFVVSDAVADERVNSLPPVTSGAVGSYLGVPLRAVTGQVIGALCVFDQAPRDWSDTDVAVLEHLAESVRAELELIGLGRDYDLSRARFDLAAQAGDIGSFDFDLVTDQLQWDDRLIAIYGYDSGDVRFDGSLASVNARLHPDDAELVAAAIAASIATVGPLVLRYRIVVPGVGIRWLEARGRSLADETGTAVRMLGVTWDVTDRHDAEDRADRVLASMSIGYLGMDHGFRVTFVNAEGRKLLGSTEADMVGETIWDLYPDTVGTEYEVVYRRVAASRAPETLEAFYPAPLNAWFEIRVVPTPDGIALYFLDITERRDADQLIQVSIDAASRLVEVDSVDDAAAVLARVLVPRLADWTIVSLIDDDGTIRDVESCHVDPAHAALLRRYAATRRDGGGSGVVETVIATGEPTRIDHDVVGFARATLPSDVATATLAELAPGSVAVVPLIAEGTVTGVVTMARGADRSPLTEQEIAVTISTCRRAGLAIENARLHALQLAAAAHDRTVAQRLQQALLTALPQPDHLHLTARYLTAADRDQVGGDWYDAVVGDGGATTVMIGDVAGHDIAAAAVMGQLRTIVRVFALQDEQPSSILTRVNHAADALGIGSTATVIAARIDQTPAERGTGRRTLRWSNAGHPPPMLLHPDGSTEVLDASPDEPRDTLIGVVSDRSRHDRAHQVTAGSTLLLYTDGLVETRTCDVDSGIARLRAALGRHHTASTDDLLDAVIDEMVGDQPGDDVAVLAVRFGDENADDPRSPGRC